MSEVRPLEPGIAEVWYTRPERSSAADAARQLALLSDAEREGHDRRLREVSRSEYRLAHALARVVLSKHQPLDPREWRFETGPHGRPEIASPRPGPRLRFNLSHTRGLVVCAVAAEVPVGIDVEHRDGRRSLERIAARMFSRREQEDIERRAGEDRLTGFLDYWTLKEAHLKALGAGMSLPMRELDFRLMQDGGAEVELGPAFEGGPAGWHYWRLRPTPDHQLSVAMAGPAAAALRLAECVP